VVMEALRSGYPWASDRLHGFIMQGMAENARAFEKSPILYYPYVETKKDAGKGFLYALAQRACMVVTDNFPGFFLPRMVDAACRQVPVCMETVDSNGILPLAAADRVFTTAYSFRRFLQKTLPSHLGRFPRARPLQNLKIPVLQALPKKITETWPMASPSSLQGDPKGLASLPIDHEVTGVKSRGGSAQGKRLLRIFLEKKLSLYPEERNHPDAEGSSGLSPYLHFGHIAVHEVFKEIIQQEEWDSGQVSRKTTGGRCGWWGMGEAAEAFLDQLITWRELGFNMCRLQNDYDQFGSLPGWALKTLHDHKKDPRSYLYSPDVFARAGTHDALWNAAQTQLLREGRIHNYLRMIWGKKILQWTASPEQALGVMTELNNKYALDGRDPNSYSGIFWVLGRYDRAWGPERPIFGKVRYMSSKNTLRKLKAREYMQKYAT
jgi:deoxyribodipyrimidine photo-lyase